MVKTIFKYLCLVGAASLMTGPAFAQEAPEHSVFILNSLLFLMAGFLVMFMAMPMIMSSTMTMTLALSRVWTLSLIHI